MKALRWLAIFLVTILHVACKPITLPQAAPAQDKVQNAMSAAPLSVAEHATILDWPTEAGGEMPVLRKGTNGWTCLPDDPNSPTNDPMCLDQMWMEWLNAYMTGREPEFSSIGLAYMLQDGSGASISDPAVTTPPPGEDWFVAPPHVMIVSPLEFEQSRFSTDPASGIPYVVWAGTPYEHLMVLVEDTAEVVASGQFAHPEAPATTE